MKKRKKNERKKPLAARKNKQDFIYDEPWKEGWYQSWVDHNGEIVGVLIPYDDEDTTSAMPKVNSEPYHVQVVGPGQIELKTGDTHQLWSLVPKW